jgi:hypothetical protein
MRRLFRKNHIRYTSNVVQLQRKDDRRMVRLTYAKAISSNAQLHQQTDRQMVQHGPSGKPREGRLMQVFHPCCPMQEFWSVNL